MSATAKRLSGIGLAMLLLLTANFGLAEQSSQTPSGTPHAHPAASDREDILIEGFEGTWLPPGWAEIWSHVNNWRQTNYISHSGQYSAVASWTPALQDNYLVTPALDFSDAVNPKLEFYEDETDWSSGYRHYIMASTTSQTDPAAFSVVEEWSPANHDIPGFDGEPTVVSLYEYAGESTVYLAFRYYGTAAASDTWYVDDVRVYLPGPHDVACIGVWPDDTHVDGGVPLTPQATVENVGSTTESFNVQMQISEAGTPVYSEVVAVSNLEPGHIVDVDFPDFTPNSGRYFDVVGTTLLAEDGNNANDVSTGIFDTFDNPHVPLGVLFTNSGCGPCVAANQYLDSYMETAGDAVALMRVHVSWPYSGDIIYLANTEQADDLVFEYGVSGVPHFFVDATYWNVEHNAAAMPAALDEARTWFSPLDIDLSWNNLAHQLTVYMNVNNTMLPGDYRLFAVITEDNIEHNGPNGEPLHHQAFRYMYPDTDTGYPVSTVMGNYAQMVPCPLDTLNWNYDELRASVYVRDMITGRAWQAASRFLREIEGGTSADGAEVYPFTLGANYPNPFNPKTSIAYSLDAAGAVSLRIYDLEGRLVTTLVEGEMAAGEHSAIWNGTDDSGQALASGVYFYRLVSGEKQQMRKMLLLK